LSASDTQGSRAYSYPQDSHRLQAVAGTARDYSEAGNTVQVDGRMLEYSGFNRFVGFAVPEFGFWGPDQLNTYNGRGEREHRYLRSEAKCLNCTESGHRIFGYDENGRLLFDTEGDTPRHKILWLDDQPIALAVAHCVFHAMPVTDSTPCRSPIPRHAGRGVGG
jgi:hypothetical protein